MNVKRVEIENTTADEIAMQVADRLKKQFNFDEDPHTIWFEFELLNQRQACTLLGISEKYFNELCRLKIIPGGKVGYHKNGEPRIMFEKHALLAIYDIVQELKNKQLDSYFKSAFNRIKDMIYTSGVRFTVKK